MPHVLEKNRRRFAVASRDVGVPHASQDPKGHVLHAEGLAEPKGAAELLLDLGHPVAAGQEECGAERLGETELVLRALARLGQTLKQS